MAAELSAATYRLFSSKARTKSGRDLYMSQSRKATPNPFPKKPGGTILGTPNGPQWDYRDTKMGGATKWMGGPPPTGNPPVASPAPGTGTRTPGSGTRPRIGTSANASTLGTTASASSTSGSNKFFGTGTHKPTTPTMRAANAAWKTTRAAAGVTSKAAKNDLRAQLNAGAITRKQFTAGFRAQANARNATIKTGRATIRTARGKFIKGTE